MMARQRFIHPSLWTDRDFGRLTPDAQLLFIGLFSNADDQGRISAEPGYLKVIIFPYRGDLSSEQVTIIRDEVASVLPTVRLYQVDGNEYISLTRWKRHQKPRYPRPSRIPPQRNHSHHANPDEQTDSAAATVTEIVDETVTVALQHRIGLGREGKAPSGLSPLDHKVKLETPPATTPLEAPSTGSPSDQPLTNETDDPILPELNGRTRPPEWKPSTPPPPTETWLIQPETP